MKLKSISIFFLIFFMSFWTSTESAELSPIPAILLKPLMLINKWFVAPMLSRPDYVCSMKPEGKNKLCQLIFNQQSIVANYKVKYSEGLKVNNFNFDCQRKTFNCFLNTYLHLNLSQDMLLCPVMTTEHGEQVKKYYISTNYTPNKVILFEAGSDERVFAVVGLCDLDLIHLNEN